jgi:hypothetical protein
VLGFGAAAFLWMLLPLFGSFHQRAHRLIVGMGCFALAYLTTMTVYGYVAK